MQNSAHRFAYEDPNLDTPRPQVLNQSPVVESSTQVKRGEYPCLELRNAPSGNDLVCRHYRFGTRKLWRDASVGTLPAGVKVATEENQGNKYRPIQHKVSSKSLHFCLSPGPEALT